jgi:tRNA U34 2-thiouridine synthase MnmA/TrmU
MKKALVLLSGGLDSLLAVKILQEQVKVEALYIKLPFSKDNSKQIREFCRKHKVKLHILDATKGKLLKKYLNIIRKPSHKRGTALNPCIDCHIFMLKLAKKFQAEIIATGEVLGERPLSQNMQALRLIEKESGLEGRLLRPLSAKLLPYTEPEKKGLIDRKRLLDIQGRKRDKQLRLAKNYRISFPSPGGGCLLCEKEYCKKLTPILGKKIEYKNIELLSIGRHFKDSEIILGRNHEENKILEKQGGIKIVPAEPGPTALIKKKKHISQAKRLIQKYSKHKIKEFKVVS